MSEEKPGCLGLILQAFGLLPNKIAPSEILPYAIRDDFLSVSELSFFKVIKQVVGNKALICPKVSLKDLFFVKMSDRGKQNIYLNKINRKHIDFLLCDPGTLKPLCAIELDDISHKREDRVARDVFINKVFETTGLILIRFENKKSYALSEIENKIVPILNVDGSSKAFPIIESNNLIAETAGSEDVPICKKCGIPMVLREAKKGENKGQTFYGCPNYPKCRETVKSVS